MTPATDDITLLQAFQEGAPWAEKQVFDRFFEPLTLYSESITRDLAAAEDIAVESITKSLDRRDRFESLAKLKSFLYQVTHNASVNHYTAEHRHQVAHERIRFQQRQDIEDYEQREVEILRAELLQEIFYEVEALPDKCGQIFRMIFIDNLSTDVIAERMGINVQTVRTQKARAIGLIRTALLKRGRMATLVFFYAWLKLHS